jgi:hypothetical protein
LGRAGDNGNKGVALAVVIFLGGCVFLGSMIFGTQRRAPSVIVNGNVYPDSVIAGKSRHARSKGHPAAEEPALLPVNLDARVLVINDVRRPWGEAVTKQVGDLMARLSGAGITVVGEGPGVEAPDAESNVELAATARLVLDGTQTPVDAPQAPTKFATWFEEKQPDVDAVVWIIQPAGSSDAQFWIFTAADAEKGAAIRQVTMAAPVKGRG